VVFLGRFKDPHTRWQQTCVKSTFAEWDGMRSFLAEDEWTSISNALSADAAWAWVTDAMEFFIPSKMSKHRYSDKAYFNDQCRAAVQC
jgi:hypothetical protein